MGKEMSSEQDQIKNIKKLVLGRTSIKYRR